MLLSPASTFHQVRIDDIDPRRLLLVMRQAELRVWLLAALLVSTWIFIGGAQSLLIISTGLISKCKQIKNVYFGPHYCILRRIVSHA
jgi:hypothetical protein